MSRSIDPETGIIFESVLFRDQFVEVSFTEPHDRGDGVARIQTVVVDGPGKVGREHQDLMQALTAFVDASIVVLANPPASIPSRVSSRG